MRNTLLVLTMSGLTTVASAGVSLFGTTAGPDPLSFPDSNAQPRLLDAVVIDLAGIQSWDGAGSSLNDLLSVPVRAGFFVLAIEWDNVVIETSGASWLSEPTIAFLDSQVGLQLTVGAGDNTPGTGGPYTSGGPIDLASLDPTFPFSIDDGFVDIEFFESFDDVAGEVDATFVSGTLTLYSIPAPGMLGCLGAGGVMLLQRRRRT